MIALAPYKEIVTGPHQGQSSKLKEEPKSPTDLFWRRIAVHGLNLRNA
jgi:hypothetical protein